MKKPYSVFDAAKDLIKGELELADQKTIEVRQSLCESCEVRNPTLNICTACGCVIPLKIKLRDSSCPMELW